MKDIKVKKAHLLEKLKANRDEHRKIFLEALDGYRKKCIELLDAELAKAKNGKQFHMYFSLTQPVDQTKDYDRAIKMLEMSVEDEVSLSELDFSNYVLDDWQWKRNFLSSNRAYSTTAALLAGQMGEGEDEPNIS